ncbi:MAG TPA: MgtC/SapB family protein [Ktedonobacteraceae bacterium]|nr:MgtC/SapB family protein [Ktedonobacteraceae bacterium]
MISFPIVLLRLVIALVLGALIGIERESSEHAAGLRTNALVALGTALFTVISAYGFTDLLSLQHVQMDPTRIASYVVAGIGFLGGGAIFLRPRDEQVKGLTTAAAIWVVAAIGMACGAGLLLEAVTGTILALLVLWGLRYLERFVLPWSPVHRHRLYVEVEAGTIEQIFGKIYAACSKAGISVESIEVHAADKENEVQTMKVACRARDGQRLIQVVSSISSIAGVQKVHMDVPEGQLQSEDSRKK